MNNLKEELKDLYVKTGYSPDFDLMWLWINQNYISKQQILNLECLKEEKITKNIFSITQLEARNKLRNQIKNEIKKL